MVRRYAGLWGLALALALGPASLQTAVAADTGACRIEVREVMWLSYGPEADNLNGFLWRGDYSIGSDVPYSGAPFEVLDLDGFATLALLHAQWRSSGIVDRNLTAPVTVAVRDLFLIQRAVDMGLRYFDVLERTARAANDPNLPAILDEIHTKRELLREAGGFASNELFLWGLAQPLSPNPGSEYEGSIFLGRGVIADRLGAGLERFVPGSPERVISQYRDVALGSRPQILCNPGAESALVGQMLCGFVFTTADRRDPGFCPDGLLVNDLSSARSCKMRNGVESECRSSVIG